MVHSLINRAFLAGCLIFLSSNLQADRLDDASVAFGQGDFQAVVKLTSSVINGAASTRQTEALIRRAEAYRALGHFREADTDLQQAVMFTRQQQQPILEIVALQALGQLQYQQQQADQAIKTLTQAQQLAQSLNQPTLVAAAANTLGQVYASQENFTQAITSYQQALELASQSGDAGLQVAAQRNLAGLQPEKALAHLQEARKKAVAVADTNERANLLLGIAIEARLSGGAKGANFGYQTLQQVLTLAKQLDSPRIRSQVNGELGAIYEANNRIADSLTLTGQAILQAQQIGSEELLLKWQWQLGRLLYAQGDFAGAIAAYQRAVNHVQSIRQDIPVVYSSGLSSFRETLSPLYLGLADLLLQQSSRVPASQQQDLLRGARDVVEQFKLSELQDYLQDACLLARTAQIDQLADDTAVLYPIILPDRLELLVAIGSQMMRATSKVSSGKLQHTVKRLAKTLRPSPTGQLRKFDRRRAQQLYKWLIEPVETFLQQHNIKTLVYVPDGALRLVPISALWNGKQFLVEKYAIATAPGLTLFDPKPIAKNKLLALMVGLAKPGPVVYEMPDLLSADLTASTEQTRRLRSMPTVVDNPQSSNSSPILRDVQRGLRLQEALALPGVTQEINSLAKQLQGVTLLDEDFELEAFAAEVGSKAYRIVHIASHGYFGGKAEDNFILTYDHKLDMNKLASLLQQKKLDKEPIELLTLSACQTAEGDDRSPLGLAGVALKSGARSALGSLWPVSDETAQQMFPNFYKELVKPGSTKATALQTAQIQLIRQKKFAHPFYWSPFILVGNWL